VPPLPRGRWGGVVRRHPNTPPGAEHVPPHPRRPALPTVTSRPLANSWSRRLFSWC